MEQTKANPDKERRYHDYRTHLLTISNGLEEMARAAGRQEYKINQLLRECYNVIHEYLRPLGWWTEEYNGRLINGKRGYLFWKVDYRTVNDIPVLEDPEDKYRDVEFLYTPDMIAFPEPDGQTSLFTHSLKINFVHSDQDCCGKCTHLFYDLDKGLYCRLHQKKVKPYNPACEDLDRILQGFGE